MTVDIFQHIWLQIWRRWKLNLEDPYILITDKKISNIQDILATVRADCTDRSKTSYYCRRYRRRGAYNIDRKQITWNIHCMLQ